MLDYIIVGLGLAGVSFCEQLEKNGKTFKVIDDDSQTSSMIAAGMYNPVIFKRFTLAWKAKEQLAVLDKFYEGIEHKLGESLNFRIPVLRRFASIGEQNAWFEAMDKRDLGDFLFQSIIESKNNCIHAPFGYGQVIGTGRIDTKKLVIGYQKYLLKKRALWLEQFDFKAFSLYEDHVVYKSVKARRIVFAEGFGMKNNPYFGYLPLNGTKGELLTIKAPDLKEESVIKASVFLIPMKNDLYRVGATYKWKDKTNLPTNEAKEELLEKLSSFLKCSFEVVEHNAGIRPTVVDRMPLVGKHPRYNGLYVLNGLGSRGVMIAPYASGQLFNFIENNEDLPPDIDIIRFTKKYYDAF